VLAVDTSETKDEKRVFRFDDITVDCREFRVRMGIEDVVLTPRAFDVLVYLLTNNGRVVEKQELFDHIWGESFVSDNALTKIIKEIRRALCDPAHQPRYIETVVKRGYRSIAAIEDPDDGSQSDPQVADRSRTRDLTRPRFFETSRVVFSALLIAVLLTAGLLMLSSWRSGVASASSFDSIAVLPLKNETQLPGLEYLSDGLTENIINALSTSSDLRVLPRDTVFHYKNSDQSAELIGQALQTRIVLSGRITKVDETLNVQIELTDVERKSQLWGRHYKFDESRMKDLQSDLARDVVDTLRLRLGELQKQKLVRNIAVEPEAQRAYLNGLFLLHQANQQSENVSIGVAARRPFCQKSITYLEHAIDIEPGYSQAYANLARAYRCLADENASEVHPKAKDAALAAVRTDDGNAAAHSILGTVLWEQDWNWVGAENEFKRALELNPNDSEARERYADILSAEGRSTESLEQIDLLERLFPGAALDNDWAGYIEKDARLYDRAIERFRRIKEVRPENTTVRYGLAEVYSLKGMHDEAIAEMQEMLRITEDRDNTKLFLGGIYARAGKRREAVDTIREYEIQPHPLSVLIASAYAAMGETSKAFYWLDRAYSEHSLDLLKGIKASPVWDVLRGDPRYSVLLTKMGLGAEPSS
jgi:adenylate cyclase